MFNRLGTVFIHYPPKVQHLIDIVKSLSPRILLRCVLFRCLTTSTNLSTDDKLSSFSVLNSIDYYITFLICLLFRKGIEWTERKETICVEKTINASERNRKCNNTLCGKTSFYEI